MATSPRRSRPLITSQTNLVMSTLPTVLRGLLTLSLLLVSLMVSAQFGGGSGDGFGSATATEEVAMPLDLISFAARPAPGGVFIEWTTENESATSHFLVERTTDGVTYTTIGTLPAAGYSESGKRLHYSLLDGDPVAGTALYRLQSVDLDGTFEYSNLVEVTLGERSALTLSVYPNPGRGSELNVQLGGLPGGERFTAELIDQVGRRVLTQELQTGSNQSLRLPTGMPLATGVYTLRVQDATYGSRAVRVVVR